MSIQAIGTDASPTMRDDSRPAGTRLTAILVSVARRLRDEVVYMIREDRDHGRIDRDPRSWER